MVVTRSGMSTRATPQEHIPDTIIEELSGDVSELNHESVFQQANALLAKYPSMKPQPKGKASKRGGKKQSTPARQMSAPLITPQKIQALEGTIPPTARQQEVEMTGAPPPPVPKFTSPQQQALPFRQGEPEKERLGAPSVSSMESVKKHLATLQAEQAQTRSDVTRIQKSITSIEELVGQIRDAQMKYEEGGPEGSTRMSVDRASTADSVSLAGSKRVYVAPPSTQQAEKNSGMDTQPAWKRSKIE